jgi:hypothetical protein
MRKSDGKIKEIEKEKTSNSSAYVRGVLLQV